MKKVFSFVLTVIICLSLIAGCSGKRPSDEEAKRAFESAIEVLALYLPGYTPIVVYSEFEGIKIEFDNDFEVDGRRFIKTDLEYDRAADKYSEIFCGDLYDNFMDKYFYDKDGILYIADGGGGGGFSLENVEVNYVEEKNGEYYYHVAFDVVIEMPTNRCESDFAVMMSDGKLKLSHLDRLIDGYPSFG